MAIDAETQRLMLNWVRWLTSSPIGMASAATYDLAPDRGWAQEAAIPLINSDAEEVDRAVKQMPEEQRQALIEYWLRSEPVPKKARRCGCSESTFWRRLERAHQAVHAFRRGQREREQKARAAYRKGQLSVAL